MVLLCLYVFLCEISVFFKFSDGNTGCTIGEVLVFFHGNQLGTYLHLVLEKHLLSLSCIMMPCLQLPVHAILSFAFQSSMVMM